MFLRNDKAESPAREQADAAKRDTPETNLERHQTSNQRAPEPVSYTSF